MADTIFNTTTANSEVIDLTEVRISSYLKFTRSIIPMSTMASTKVS